MVVPTIPPLVTPWIDYQKYDRGGEVRDMVLEEVLEEFKLKYVPFPIPLDCSLPTFVKDLTNIMAFLLLSLSVLAAAVFLGSCRIIYNVFFHPLRKFPGPWMAGATSSWKAYKEVIKQETLAQELFDLHAKYGETNWESNQNMVFFSNATTTSR